MAIGAAFQHGRRLRLVAGDAVPWRSPLGSVTTKVLDGRHGTIGTGRPVLDAWTEDIRERDAIPRSGGGFSCSFSTSLPAVRSLGLRYTSCLIFLPSLPAMRLHALLLGCVLNLFLVPLIGHAADSTLRVYPESIRLRGRESQHRILVSEETLTDGATRWVDCAGRATFRSLDPAVATVDASGVVIAIGDGETRVEVQVGEQKTELPIVVEAAATRPRVSFELDVQPILTANGCSVGACHGKARGQNGFQLSLLCFDPNFDHNALTREARGRRISFASPRNSLLLRKASGQTPHGGGIRLQPDGRDYDTLLRWIADGAPRSLPDEPELTAIEIFPPARRMVPRETQRTLVLARYSDGSVVDVTDRSAFQSNEDAVVSVDKQGLIHAGPIPGEATIMARFMGRIATLDVVIPLAGETPPQLFAQLPRNNFIDEHVYTKLQTLGITPSPSADDAVFLRRAYIDIIGRIPSSDEVRRFLDDDSPNKREALIDRLLERPEYADHWANQWADLLRPNPYRVGIKAVFNYDNWIREQFRRNRPYDEMVRDLVTAQGSTWRNGAATLYRDRRSPDELATLFSQLFLGIRLECAKCHHHPFEKWSQEDFYSFAAYFARVGRKGTGLSPPISGGEEIVLVSKRGSVSHPLTGETLEPRPLFGEALDVAELDDPREALAAWMTSPENEYFSQTIVNRVWAEMMGRGIVVPVDDLRATNPPSNGPLLRALAGDFRDAGFNLKHLIKTIAMSHVYSLSSSPTERNVADTRNYSRHYRVRLRAEVMLDAVSDITGKRFDFAAMPKESRAAQIWTHRVSSIFLDTFGRPDPNQDPPCERTPESTVAQVLHLMNAPQLHTKITASDGRSSELANGDLKAEQIVEELYLSIYGRPPTKLESERVAAIIPEEKADRRQVIQDLMWAMINSPEFVYEN